VFVIVLHAWWALEAAEMRLWGEDASRYVVPKVARGIRSRVRPHPYAAPGRAVRTPIGVAGAALADWSGVLLMPSGRAIPCPSPWLGVEEHPADEIAAWKVPAVAVDAASVARVVRALVASSARLSDSVQHVVEVVAFAEDLVSRGRVVPVLAHEGQEALPHARWRKVLTAGDADRRHELIAGMPASVRCAERRAEWPSDATELFDAMLDALVDGAAREALRRLPRPPREPGAGAADAWLRALVTPAALVRGPAETVDELAESVTAWAGAGAAEADALRTCFRLIPPAEGRIDGWAIELGVQLRDDPTVSASAVEVWRVPAEGGTVLGHHILEPHARLAADTARAARVFPAVAEAADDPLGRAVIDAEGALTFLRSAAPALEARGFGVIAPAWWANRRNRLGARVRLRPHAGARAGGLLGLDGICDVDWEIVLAGSAITLEELRDLAEQQAPLVRARGQWVEVDPRVVARALELFGSGESGQTLSVRDALSTVLGAQDEWEGLPIVDVAADGWLAALLTADADGIEDATDPVDLHGELRPYQRRGLAWLGFTHRHGLGALLADDMGLGKTVQLLALLLAEREDGATPLPTLLVCPMSLVENWRHESERFAPSLRVAIHHGPERARGDASEQYADTDLVLTTYALASRDAEDLAAGAWGRIVLDEAQAIKNPSSGVARAVRTFVAPHRVALTGTPVENRLSDLWSIMDFLNPGLLGSATGFARRFATPIEREHDASAAERLTRLTRPFILRRLKTDRTVIADLPEKVEMKVYVQLTTEQAALYSSTVDEMLARVAERSGIERRGLVLATLTRLKQICDHPALLLRGSPPTAERSGKLALLDEVVDEILAADERVLVFTQYAEMGHLLQKHLTSTLEREVLYLHGGVPRTARTTMVRRFQEPDGPSVFVLSLKAGGAGLNLVAASHVVHYDRWWNPAVEQQATDRAFRIGQTRDVQVRKLICTGTVEDRIDQLIEGKRDLAERIVGGGESWLATLDTEQLRDIVALSGDAVGVA
jgi:non-specific serine/threonine protein kinase